MTSSKTLYDKMAASATAFAHAPNYSPTSEPFSRDKMLALRAPGMKASWGHNYMASERPSLSQTLGNEAFLDHVEGMGSLLSAIAAKMTDVVIDEKQRKAVVRASYMMTVPGHEGGKEETIENDVVWLLTLTDDGEKIERSVEFIDGDAGTKVMGLRAAVAARK